MALPLACTSDAHGPLFHTRTSLPTLSGRYAEAEQRKLKEEQERAEADAKAAAEAEAELQKAYDEAQAALKETQKQRLIEAEKEAKMEVR